MSRISRISRFLLNEWLDNPAVDVDAVGPQEECQQYCHAHHLRAFQELVAGLAAIPVTPLCKKLWSPSFTLCVAAYSTAMFALFYWLADVKMWRRWTFFFVVIGVNAIAIYVLQWFVGFRSISKFFLGGLASLLPPTGGELLLACGYLAACWLTLYFLYRKKAFFKV